MPDSEYDSNDSNSFDMYEKIRYKIRIKKRTKAQLPVLLSPTPLQNSPQHILTILTDECIQYILRCLIGNIRNFLNAANVCKRFQDNAKKCFPSVYTDFCITRPIFNDELPLNDVICFLKLFGHLIRSIKWNLAYVKSSASTLSLDAEIFKTIAKYCGKNLIKFECDGHHFDFNHGSDFTAMEELNIMWGTISNFKIPSGLKKLFLRCTRMEDCDWSSESRVSTLNEALFVNVNQFTDKCLLEFLRLNPQLERLAFTNGSTDHIITLPILEKIPLLVPNLVQLEIPSMKCHDVNFMSLIGLRKLKALKLGIPIIPSELIDSIVEHEIPLEEFEITVQS